jgi:hypothetical protein
MRAIVCGSREFNSISYAYLSSVLGSLGLTEIIAGGASGVDSYAVSYAKARRVDYRVYFPKWLVDQKAAGPIRNKRMLDEGNPDVVIAFWGGRGTADMIRQATARGVRVIEVPGDPDTEWWRAKYLRGERDVTQHSEAT